MSEVTGYRSRPVGEAGLLDTALDRALDPLLEQPRLAPAAEVAFGETRWQEPFAILTGHNGGPYVRMEAEAGELANVLDGSTTVAEAAMAAGIEFDYALDLVDALRRAAVIEGRVIDVYEIVEHRTRPRWRRATDRAWRSLRGQRIDLPGLDRLAGAMYRAGGRLLFTWPAAVGSVTVVVAGFGAFVATARRGDLELASEISGAEAAVIFVALFGALVLHELGHALAVKWAGRRVIGGGLQLYLGHPAFFIDSTDLLFAPRRQRALNAALGPYIEAVIAGLVALFVWRWPAAPGVDIATRVAIVTYVNVALNLIPFVELDGYWVLTDLFDIPRLRARSLALLRSEVPARVRRDRAAFDARERGLIVFGVLGVAFTLAALVTAWFFWWPLLEALARGLWNAGTLGRLLLALLAIVLAGPLAEAAVRVGRSVTRLAKRIVADVVFRLQRTWRIEAAEAIARLHDDSLDDEVLSDLAGRVRRRVIGAGEEVVALGDGGHDWFVVRRGRFEVVGAGGDVLAVLVAGEAFGERALLNRGPRTASVRAIDAAEVFVLDGGAYLRALAPERARVDVP